MRTLPSPSIRLLVALLIGPGSLSFAATYTVVNLNDSGAGSLRQAIENATDGAVVVFSDGLSGTITLTSGALQITNSIDVLGPGPRVISVSGNGASGVFSIPLILASHPVFHVLLSGLTITNGLSSDSGGGGIFNDGVLTISNCVICGNKTPPCGLLGCAAGGGIYNFNTCAIINSTIWGNQGGGGGAIFTSSGGLSLVNCTICSNISYVNYGAIFSGGPVAMTNCTLVGNQANAANGVGGIDASSQYPTTIANSIIAGNTALGSPGDVSGPFTSLGFNLIGSTNGSTGFGLVGSQDQAGSATVPLDPVLAPLQDNGGPTPTMAPTFFSPVIDQGKSFGTPTDQRGKPRPYDNLSIPNAAGGDGADIGAYEAGTNLFLVTNTNDNGPGSLRQALQFADNSADFDTITFAPNVSGVIYLTSGELPIDASVNIIGPGAKVLSINGLSAGGVLDLGYGTVTVSGLTMTEGGSPAINNSADLTLVDCLINSASGAGISSDGPNLRLLRCTLMQNRDNGLVIFPGAVASATNSTFISNQSSTYGGGIYNQGALTLRSCTIAGNYAFYDGGGIYNSGTVDIGNTIVAENSAPNNAPYGQDVSGDFVSSGYNLIGQSDGSSSFINGVSQDQVGNSASPLDPRLGPLQDNGGPTPTLSPQIGSPAIDQGNSFGLTADQRGCLRPLDFSQIPNAAGGDGSDIGAVEAWSSYGCAGECASQVTLDAGQTLRTVDARWFGANTAVWDYGFDSPDTLSLLVEMGCRTLRFPGGSFADLYHWPSNYVVGSSWEGWPTTFPNFMHIATNLGTAVFITANYGTGTADEAAGWVRSANLTNGCGFKYWEIGNECYGSWEADSNTIAPYMPHDPWTYAMRFRDYYTAMKAVDPTIKVGVVAVPGEDSYENNAAHPAYNPRTGRTHYGWTPVLLATLQSLGVTPDFLIHHFYPEYLVDNDPFLLQAASNWANDAADLRQQISDYFGAGGTGIELLCTENNADAGPQGKQSTSLVSALYLADSLGRIMKTEFNSFLWWDWENGQDTGGDFDPSLYGWRTYGDMGLVLNASARYPTFYAMKLMRYFAQPGDTILNPASGDPFLAVYAAKKTSGAITLLAINKDPLNTLTRQMTLTGFAANAVCSVRSYGIPQDEAARTNGPAGAQDIALGNFAPVSPVFMYSFPPYSLTLLTFVPPPPNLVVLPPTPQPNRPFIFQLQGQPDLPYALQTSTDLVQWTDAANVTLPTGILNFTNPVPSGSGRQFWRAVWRP
jgi:alpha-L-arabinofuranosidase